MRSGVEFLQRDAKHMMTVRVTKICLKKDFICINLEDVVCGVDYTDRCSSDSWSAPSKSLFRHFQLSLNGQFLDVSVYKDASSIPFLRRREHPQPSSMGWEHFCL